VKTRKQLLKEIDQLKADNATMRILLRAYMQMNHRLQDDIELLNASLDCCAADRERWAEIARKADKRRKEYVLRNMASAD